MTIPDPFLFEVEGAYTYRMVREGTNSYRVDAKLKEPDASGVIPTFARIGKFKVLESELLTDNMLKGTNLGTVTTALAMSKAMVQAKKHEEKQRSIRSRGSHPGQLPGRRVTREALSPGRSIRSSAKRLL